MSLEIVSDPQARCTMLKQYTYKIAWQPEKHYVAGTQMEIRVHCLRAFLSWLYVGFNLRSAGDVTFRWKSRPSVSDLRSNWNRILFRASLPYGVRKGETVEIELTVVPPIWAGIDSHLSIWTIDVPNNFQADPPEIPAVREPGSECVLAVKAGPVERLSVYSRPAPGPDGKVRTLIVPEDRFGNPSSFDQAVNARIQWLNESTDLVMESTCVVDLPTPERTERAVVSIPMNELSPGENIANGTRRDGLLVVRGNPVWPEAPRNLTPAFGEFHWHTDISGDGQRPIREAIRCARDELNMDFVAPGDHNPQGADWLDTVAALDEFNQAGFFATFYGWENASDRGHDNYYFTDPEHPIVCNGSAGLKGGRPDKVAGILRKVHSEHDFIAIAHHTNSVAETRKQTDDSPYWHQYPWGPPEKHLRLVEIFQCRGNQERNVYDDAWRGWHQNYHASAQDALALGHKIGFVGGTDNHCGWPGRGFAKCEGLGIHPAKSVILTGTWTQKIERQSVYNALNARHTWAVWDTRAIVWFTVNDAMSGEVLILEKGTRINAHLKLSAEDVLQTVEIVSDSETVWQKSFETMDIEIDIPLDKVKHSTYFYLRALQRDGGIIYASPVFVECR